MPEMQDDDLSIVRATILAPILAPVIYIAEELLFSDLAPHDSKEGFVKILLTFLYLSPISYGATVILGWPVFVWLKKSGRLNVKSMVISGFVIGTLLYGTSMLVLGSHGTESMISPRLILLLGIGGAMGMGVAFGFSVISGITHASSGRAKGARR